MCFLITCISSLHTSRVLITYVSQILCVSQSHVYLNYIKTFHMFNYRCLNFWNEHIKYNLMNGTEVYLSIVKMNLIWMIYLMFIRNSISITTIKLTWIDPIYPVFLPKSFHDHYFMHFCDFSTLYQLLLLSVHPVCYTVCDILFNYLVS